MIILNQIAICDSLVFSNPINFIRFHSNYTESYNSLQVEIPYYLNAPLNMFLKKSNALKYLKTKVFICFADTIKGRHIIYRYIAGTQMI
jgi:hypothetical protein